MELFLSPIFRPGGRSLVDRQKQNGIPTSGRKKRTGPLGRTGRSGRTSQSDWFRQRVMDGGSWLMFHFRKNLGFSGFPECIDGNCLWDSRITATFFRPFLGAQTALGHCEKIVLFFMVLQVSAGPTLQPIVIICHHSPRIRWVNSRRIFSRKIHHRTPHYDHYAPICTTFFGPRWGLLLPANNFLWNSGCLGPAPWLHQREVPGGLPLLFNHHLEWWSKP